MGDALIQIISQAGFPRDLGQVPQLLPASVSPVQC